MELTKDDDPTWAQDLMERVALLCVAILLNFGLLWVAGESLYHVGAQNLPPPDAMLTVFVRPEIVDQADIPAPQLSQIKLRIDHLLTTVIADPPDFSQPVARNQAAVVVAPSLHPDEPVSIRDYAQAAGLARGSGATVVLRIEVRETGDPGRIEIDVSSGESKVDSAAVDYARAHRWYAGWISNQPRSMWIRWAVHLQA